MEKRTAFDSLKCSNCRRNFEPSKTQQKLIQKLLAADAPLAMLKCPNCGLGMPVDLRRSKAETDELHYRCPVASCTGWVVFVKPPRRRHGFWGCGECGHQWKVDDEFQAAITAILGRYKYRQKSYRRKAGKWLPNDLAREAPEYEALVEQEPYVAPPKHKE